MLTACRFGESARLAKICRGAMVALLVALFVFVLLTFRDFGITWDEELQSQYGLAVVDYYLSLFQDHRFEQIFNLYLYGGLFDGFASIFDRFTPTTVYETRHLLNALTGLLGIWGTWKLARLLGGSVAGLLAAVFLTLTPMYLGPMFNNPKDIPFAAGIVWTLYYMAKGYGIEGLGTDFDVQKGVIARCRTFFSTFFRSKAALPHSFHEGAGIRAGFSARWRWMVKLGVMLGLTLGVRVGGAMVIAFWLAPWGLEALARLMQIKRNKEIRESLIRFFKHYVIDVGLRIVLPICAVAYVVMLLCWPWAQSHPIANPLRALSEFSNFPQDVEVLIAGKIRRSTQLPWHYAPFYFMVQLPEYLLVLLGASFAVLPFSAWRMEGARRKGLLLVALMAFMPILYAMARRPALYDGVRHFTFTVPLFCVFAALTVVQVAAWIRQRIDSEAVRRKALMAALLVGVCVAAWQVRILAALHPYEYIYANAFAGGVKGIYGRYELDYWGSSFKEAAQKIQQLVASEGGVPAGQMYRIAICGPWSAAMIYMPPDFDAVEADKPAEFFLSTTRWMCQNMRPGREAIRIERMGAPLSIVKDLRPLKESKH